MTPASLVCLDHTSLRRGNSSVPLAQLSLVNLALHKQLVPEALLIAKVKLHTTSIYKKRDSVLFNFTSCHFLQDWRLNGVSNNVAFVLFDRLTNHFVLLQKNVPLVNSTTRKRSFAALAVMVLTNLAKERSPAWPALEDRLPELLKPYRLRNAGTTVLQVNIKWKQWLPTTWRLCFATTHCLLYISLPGYWSKFVYSRWTVKQRWWLWAVPTRNIPSVRCWCGLCFLSTRHDHTSVRRRFCWSVLTACL